VPSLFLFSIFTRRLPVVGEYEQPITLFLGLAYAFLNYQYFHGYVESAEGRIPAFKKRVLVFSIVFFGAMGAMGYAAFEKFAKV